MSPEINRGSRRLTPLLGCVASICILLSACASSSNSPGETRTSITEQDIAQLTAVVQGILPACRLQKLDLPKSGQLSGMSSARYHQVTELIHPFSDFGGVLSNPKRILATVESSGWITNRSENVTSWSLNMLTDIYTCNTSGLPLSKIADYFDSYNAHHSAFQSGRSGGGDCSRFYKDSKTGGYTASDRRDAKRCLTILKEFEDSGSWITFATVSEATTPKQYLATRVAALDEVYESSSNSYYMPMAFNEKFIFTISNFFYATHQTFQRSQTEWSDLVNGLNATTWDVLGGGLSGVSATVSEEKDRETFLNSILNPETKSVACSSKLRISESTASSGDCGKLSIDVFQSDLNTGSCNFLAHWTDKSGAERIGIFEYCGAFSEGSINENSTYTLRVSVIGPAEYTTKTGAQNVVLSFQVLGE